MPGTISFLFLYPQDLAEYLSHERNIMFVDCVDLDEENFAQKIKRNATKDIEE